MSLNFPTRNTENTNNLWFNTLPIQKEVQETESLDSSLSLPNDVQAESNSSTTLTTPEKVHNSIKSRLYLEDDEISQLTTNVYSVQRKLFETGQQGSSFEASEEFPYSGVIDTNSFTVLQKRIGTGTFNEVFKGIYFPTKRHRLPTAPLCSPSKPVDKAIKRQRLCTDVPPDAVADKLYAILGITPDSGPVENIDVHQKVIKTDQGTYYSIHELLSGDFYDHETHRSPTPILDIITTFAGASRGLKQLHDGDGIHRDIKTENILVEVDSQGSVKRATVTDHDFLISQDEDINNIAGTLEFLDPSQFGDEATCLPNQADGFVLQTQSGDIFALGTALGYSGIFKFLHSKVLTDPRAPASLIDRMGNLSKQMLPQNFAVKAPARENLRRDGHRIGYAYLTQIDKETDVGKLIVPVCSQKFFENIAAAITMTKSYFSAREIEALQELAFLSASMRNYPSADGSCVRPTLEVVIENLEAIRRNLVTEEPQAPTSSQQATDPWNDAC